MKAWLSLLLVLVLLLCMGSGVCAATDPTADLVVTNLAWTGGDGQVTPGTSLVFSVTVKNQGAVAATVPFTVDIAFGTERLFRLTHEGGLAVGGEATLTTPAWTVTSGDKMISARVNSTDTVPEKERWDNDVLQRNLRIAGDRYAPTYDTVTEAVTEAGMFDLTFSEDFNDVSGFDTGVSGKEGYKWYVRRHAAFPLLKPEDYRTENGILTMDCPIDTFAVGAATIDRITGVGYTFTHGYLEFRLRAPVVGKKDESKIAVWSFPRERYTEKEAYTTHVEMDWLEYYGGNYATVTLHEISDIGNQRHWYATDKGNFNALGDQQWHTMGYLWEEGSLRCYLDGKLFFTQTWSPDDMPMPPNIVKSGDIKFDGVFSYADTQDMMLFIFGSSKIPLEIDYVRIWQHGGTAPEKPKPTTTTTTTTKPTVTTTTAAPTATTTTAKTPVTTVTNERDEIITTLPPTVTNTDGELITTEANGTIDPTLIGDQNGSETQPTGSTTAAQSANAPASSAWWWILLPVGLAAAITTTLLVLKKKKQ